MALPIMSTPVLRGKDAERFERLADIALHAEKTTLSEIVVDWQTIHRIQASKSTRAKV